jgi:hypothetical protein
MKQGDKFKCKYSSKLKEDTIMRFYGFTEVINHPRGFSYIGIYLDESQSLGHCLMIACWNTITLELMEWD